MAVYVDNARIGRVRGRWSHLIADTPDELHTFAASIGLKRSWFQPGKSYGGRPPRHWHYDVTDSVRARAIAAGARPIDIRECGEIMRARNQAGPASTTNHLSGKDTGTMTIQITVIGNLTENPDLRYTNSGTAVATMTVAVNERYRDNGSGEWKDGPTSFCRVNAWRDLADHAAESLSKGDRVMVYGTLRQRSYNVEPTGPKDSGKRQVWEVQATEIGAALRYAKVGISKVKRDAVPVPEDPWAREDQAPADDKPPF